MAIWTRFRQEADWTILRNASSVTGGLAVMSLLGVVYWWVATRMLPPSAVGLGAAAVSATGAGEYFIRAAVAHSICARIQLNGESAQAAADAVIADVAALGGSGGVIVVTPKGETVYAFNTPGMYRGTASPEGRTVAIFGDE